MNAANDLSGRTFGQYRLLHLLGRGGMGEVYEAEHKVLQKRYALKFLPADFASRPGALERFQREAAVMARLNHPNIVQVDDFGETDDRYWLRMELAQGGSVEGKAVKSLEEYAAAKGGVVPEESLLGFLKQVVAGLGYAHDQGVVHRDIKPANILLNQDEGDVAMRPQITDFGLVHMVGDDWLKSMAEQSMMSMSMGDQVTMAEGDSSGNRALIGTLEYMSPEQRAGLDLDHRSDIYSLGLLIFRLLTGRKNLSFKLPSQLVPGLSKAWDELVAMALEEDPEERISDCAELMDYLDSVKGGASPAPKPPPVEKPEPQPAETIVPLERLQKREMAWSHHLDGPEKVTSLMLVDYLMEVLDGASKSDCFKVIDGFWNYVIDENNLPGKNNPQENKEERNVRYLVVPRFGTFRIIRCGRGTFNPKLPVYLDFKSKNREALAKDYALFYRERIPSSAWMRAARSKKLSVKRKMICAMAADQNLDLSFVNQAFFELLCVLVRIFIDKKKTIAWLMHGKMSPVCACTLPNGAGKKVTYPKGRHYTFLPQRRLEKRITICKKN